MFQPDEEVALREILRNVRYVGGLEEIDPTERQLRQYDYLQFVLMERRREGEPDAPVLELMARVLQGDFVQGGEPIQLRPFREARKIVSTEELEDDIRRLNQAVGAAAPDAQSVRRRSGGAS